MWQDIAVSPLAGEGVQNDWSYHFHGQQLLSGAYGLVWANNIFLFTQYEADKQQLLIFVQFITKGDAWMIIESEWDWHVLGRGISSPGNRFANGFETNWIRSFAQSI